MRMHSVVTRKGDAKSNMEAYTKRTSAKVSEGLKKACLHLMKVSFPLVPKDTQALALSGVIVVKGEGFGTTYFAGYGLKGLTGTVLFGPNQAPWVTVGFSRKEGGKDKTKIPANYAKKQHWEVWLHHVHGGQALFLQQPIRTERMTMARIIRDTVRA